MDRDQKLVLGTILTQEEKTEILQRLNVEDLQNPNLTLEEKLELIGRPDLTLEQCLELTFELLALQKARNRGLWEENKLLKDLAHRDPLTNLLNRQGLERDASRVLTNMKLASPGGDRRQKKGTEATVLVLDIDNFKWINDSISHDAGDQVLRQVAKYLENNSRRIIDSVARSGGEEFVIIFDGLSPEEVLDRFKISDTGLTQMNFTAQVSITDGQGNLRTIDLPISFSGGVAACQPDEEIWATIDRADQKLLEAKRLGKNRILRADRAEGEDK